MTDHDRVARAGIDIPRPVQKVQIAVKEGIELQELQATLERIVTLAGCRTCGLVGLDLVLRGVDPVEQHFVDLAGIRSVTVER